LKEVQGRVLVSPTRNIGKPGRHWLERQGMSGRERTPYLLQIADKGYEKAMEENGALRKGLNLIHGQVVYQAVAESLGLKSPS
jgi:hypothetical protein